MKVGDCQFYLFSFFGVVAKFTCYFVLQPQGDGMKIYNPPPRKKTESRSVAANKKHKMNIPAYTLASIERKRKIKLEARFILEKSSVIHSSIIITHNRTNLLQRLLIDN